jgi:hypothetical protein
MLLWKFMDFEGIISSYSLRMVPLSAEIFLKISPTDLTTRVLLSRNFMLFHQTVITSEVLYDTVADKFILMSTLGHSSLINLRFLFFSAVGFWETFAQN